MTDEEEKPAVRWFKSIVASYCMGKLSNLNDAQRLNNATVLQDKSKAASQLSLLIGGFTTLGTLIEAFGDDPGPISEKLVGVIWAIILTYSAFSFFRLVASTYQQHIDHIRDRLCTDEAARNRFEHDNIVVQSQLRLQAQQAEEKARARAAERDERQGSYELESKIRYQHRMRADAIERGDHRYAAQASAEIAILEARLRKRGS